MATVTNTFLKPDGSAEAAMTVSVDVYHGPFSTYGPSGVSQTTSVSRLVTTTGADGTWSQVLREGVYSLTWRSGVGHYWNRAYLAVPEYDATYALKSLLLTDPASITFQSAAFKEFDTIGDMVSYDARLWEQAQVWNYVEGDHVFSIWVKSSDQTILPNNTDIVATSAGIVLIRIYVREPGDGVVVPPLPLAAYTVNVPVTVPSITDLRASMFSAPLVWVGDASSPTAWIRGTSNSLDDGVNGVLNGAGVHYDRVRFE